MSEGAGPGVAFPAQVTTVFSVSPELPEVYEVQVVKCLCVVCVCGWSVCVFVVSVWCVCALCVCVVCMGCDVSAVGTCVQWGEGGHGVWAKVPAQPSVVGNQFARGCWVRGRVTKLSWL